MKNLKTYEEFDYSGLLPFAYYGIGMLLVKLGIKFADNKRAKNFFQKMMSDNTYTNGKWIISEENNIISLSKSKAISFYIDKNKKTFEYKSDVYPFKIKLNKLEFDKLIDGINFSKEVNESIDDCFYDLKDVGYYVSLDRIDFSKNSFSISIIKIPSTTSDEEDYDEEDYYDIDGGYPTTNNISLEKIAILLDDCLYRITHQYNVTIDKNFKDEFSSHRYDEQILYSYNNGVILLSNGENYDVNKDLEANKNNYIPNNIHSLRIPFIKK